MYRLHACRRQTVISARFIASSSPPLNLGNIDKSPQACPGQTAIGPSRLVVGSFWIPELFLSNASSI
ncbi:hypothetical protein GLOTRDRAFT_111820 [Gloeophyllum trabeum ATCC 11539]|uniref:Uncharacterized protein n=1 Tax=Gloeophyllum trabeum (strain ATCC 11539 / FP-39264 / Madison 617) TaxID=670483 RepID=S7Q0M4_GLOTA|nr:uncharacterized protein GLOTRDRAFT_111820 [Gloeophyllum trabeum ATCC 11539]EPQ53022.1 hypothetical protein GLOTRDRAFT_111820 [Gloeophyllum trabeum ATCC 11539]